MEMFDQNMDEFFDLNPFLAELYSTAAAASYSDHGSTTSSSVAAAFDSSTMAAATNPLFISFEEAGCSSFSPTNAYHHQHATDGNLAPQIISFSSSARDDHPDKMETASPATRTPIQAQDHVIAERKRRDHLRQLFISLSKIVPGLRKLDKVSLLDDAINYLKVLQERVIALEKEEMIDNKSCSFLASPSDTSPTEISARIADRNVLIKICCKKQMGLMSRIPCEMERMHLSVIDIRIMPFGGEALDVTILAEMNSGYVGTVKDIINHLQAVLGQVEERRDNHP